MKITSLKQRCYLLRSEIESVRVGRSSTSSWDRLGRAGFQYFSIIMGAISACYRSSMIDHALWGDTVQKVARADASCVRWRWRRFYDNGVQVYCISLTRCGCGGHSSHGARGARGEDINNMEHKGPDHQARRVDLCPRSVGFHRFSHPIDRDEPLRPFYTLASSSCFPATRPSFCERRVWRVEDLVIVSFPFVPSSVGIHIRIFEFTSYSSTTFSSCASQPSLRQRSSFHLLHSPPLSSQIPSPPSREVMTSGIMASMKQIDRALNNALSIANQLKLQDVVDTIRQAQGSFILVPLKAEVDTLASLDQFGIRTSLAWRIK